MRSACRQRGARTLRKCLSHCDLCFAVVGKDLFVATYDDCQDGTESHDHRVVEIGTDGHCGNPSKS